MKSLRTVRYSLIAAAVAGSAVVSTPALADVSATASVANMYLWRGQNLGGGAPVVAGSLDYSHDSGLFAGIWGSSAGPGQETDVYFGYAYSSDAFNFKVTAYEYFYPNNTPIDLQEVVFSVGASGFFADFVLGIGEIDAAGGGVDNKNNYVDIGYTMDKFTVKLGKTLNDTADTDYTHLDLSYAFNKNIAFTLSNIVDADTAAAITAGPADENQDPLFVVSYTLPIDLK